MPNTVQHGEPKPYEPPLCATPGCGHSIHLHRLPELPPRVRKACSAGHGPAGTPCVCGKYTAAGHG